MCVHVSMHVHMRVQARPGLTLLTPQAHIAGFTHTQATDSVTAPVAHTAVAGVAAVGSPVATVTGCNRATEAGHPAQVTAARSGVGRDAWTPGHLPLWQLRPVHPGAQLHWPVTGWQSPSLAQEHRVWQLGPNHPAGQAAGGDRLSIAGAGHGAGRDCRQG